MQHCSALLHIFTVDCSDDNLVVDVGRCSAGALLRTIIPIGILYHTHNVMNKLIPRCYCIEQTIRKFLGFITQSVHFTNCCCLLLNFSSFQNMRQKSRTISDIHRSAAIRPCTKLSPILSIHELKTKLNELSINYHLLKPTQVKVALQSKFINLSYGVHKQSTLLQTYCVFKGECLVASTKCLDTRKVSFIKSDFLTHFFKLMILFTNLPFSQISFQVIAFSTKSFSFQLSLYASVYMSHFLDDSRKKTRK